ncbi:MAG TPA: ParB/RepB/Spo0J family partition protein [Pyrinomonadaceae bacterium]|nr:ParB/RepB/Spo0J family partition protein [Pyrinomonadaceae bacterium]
MNRKALGRGLGALLSSDTSVDLGPEPTEVDVDAIVPGPMQPRLHFDEDALKGLADSIRSQGIIQPLLVRRVGDRYELIAGERRWRAARLAGLSKVPVVVKDVPDKDLLEIALIENIQRENLNPIEEAQAYQRLIETVGLTQEALAARVGRDRSYITNYLRLLRLPEDLQKCVVEGQLSTGHARAIVVLLDVEVQRNIAKRVIERGLSVRVTEQLVREAANGKAPRKTASTEQPDNHSGKDPNIKEAEKKLSRALGREVRIVPTNGERQGQVEISFFSNEELNYIYNLLMSATTKL